MFSALPADWLGWSFGGGLSFVFLWLISVPPVQGGVGVGEVIGQVVE